MSARSPHLPTLHPAQLRPLRTRLRLSIRNAGLTDLNHAPAPGNQPFWELEPTPLVVSAEEWTLLEAALRQRAHFVNALLVDLYSGQQALEQKLLSPEIVLCDPYYRRPCLGLEPGRASPATLLRFDLVKTAGGWLFTDTRANTPIGLSYAVQNRRFMTQEAADLYRALPDYHSVINFPLQLLESLHALAPDTGRAPSIVVLTAGPHDPFYSEHSFLARKMGLPLARGDDLLVLDNRVYFKTIAGLERVDVLYRRLNDAYIDPVVFSTDRETAGIPGLLQCIRAGTVVIANAIGTGVAESRALNAYANPLMRFYLGEKPLLPSIPTFTCGDTDHLDYILEHRDSLRIRPAHDPRLGDPRLHAPKPVLLDARGLAQSVRENPHAYVAQPELALLPINPRARQSAPFRLSAFVLCQGKRFSVFPGGLVRIGETDPCIERVGVSADAIVLVSTQGSSGEVADLETAAVNGVQTHTLGSRAAENLFWLGRYLERAEATARMLSILDDVALEEIPARERRRWLPVWRGLLEATGHTDHKITARTNPQATLSTDLMWRMSLDAANSSSIYSSIDWAVENARQLRDYVSPEVWITLSRLLARLADLQALRPASGNRGRARTNHAPSPSALAVQAVLTEVNALLGIAERTMLQDSGWHFLRMGLHLERATMTCSSLRHLLGALDLAAAAPSPRRQRDNPELSALLRMLGSQDAYRRLYQTRSQPRFVAELFLKQTEAPRSIFHNLHQIKTSLRAIRLDTHDDEPDPTTEFVNETLHFLASVPLARHFNGETAIDDAEAAKLKDTLATLLKRLYELHPLLSDHYFSHQARITPAPAQVELKL
ncbi:MAG: circularly permuted type 2 ATP-grasp protein [Verrucomicrobia bacterium]|nr:circularly permuted type 2 ATP-grasp protein [Verrucomicrobiota bacterium]